MHLRGDIELVQEDFFITLCKNFTINLFNKKGRFVLAKLQVLKKYLYLVSREKEKLVLIMHVEKVFKLTIIVTDSRADFF